jgi:P-type E1-E2 ATPase
LHGGTLVTAGTAEAVVVATGDRTELGRISGLLGTVEPTQTPLTRNVARLGSTLTKVIGVVAVVLLGVALLRGYPFADAAMAAITLAVAAIPEGLPAIVTIALAIGVQRMARRHAFVRELPAVETLGSTSVVCTDKTGTLTRNEMVQRRAWTAQGDEAEFAPSSTGTPPPGCACLRSPSGPAVPSTRRSTTTSDSSGSSA